MTECNCTKLSRCSKRGWPTMIRHTHFFHLNHNHKPYYAGGSLNNMYMNAYQLDRCGWQQRPRTKHVSHHHPPTSSTADSVYTACRSSLQYIRFSHVSKYTRICRYKLSSHTHTHTLSLSFSQFLLYLYHHTTTDHFIATSLSWIVHPEVWLKNRTIACRG